MAVPAEVDLRALDLFGRLANHPGNARLRARLLRRECEAVLQRLAQLEAGHRARAAMPTEMPDPACAARPAPPPRIGPFRLTAPIGQGGMGEVWRAERDDGLFEQTVAIKFIAANLDAEASAAFDRERRILARLDHPDIVRLIDGGVTKEGLPYLIMAHVEGQPFDLAVKPLSIGRRISLFLRMLAAVQFAHGKLVAHADLKPSNVLVDAAGCVRLLDFGISELLTAERNAGRPRGAMTVAFASPQRVAGAAPSIADDVYALGVLLRLCVAEAEDADLAAIIARASAREESARYPTVAALADELQRWQARLPVSARPASLAYVAGRFVARNKRPVLAATLAVLALLATTAAATLASIRAEQARLESASRFEDARGTARYLLFTLLDRLEAKPNTLALRSEVAGVAQTYLDRLAHAPDAPAEMLAETAQGYIRLAESQGVPGHPNLDNGVLAQANLEHAMALLGRAPDGGAAALAVKARIEDAHLQSYVNNNPDEALRLLDAAAAIAATRHGLPSLLLAQLRNERADALEWKGRYDQAIGLAREALTLLGTRSDIDGLVAEASAIEIIADCDRASFRLDLSASGYLRQVALYEAAARQNPGSRRLRRQLARARWMWAAQDTDHPSQETLAALAAAAAELRALAAFDSDDADTPRLANYADADRARMLAKAGQLDAALRLIRANLALEAEQSRQHPAELQWFRDQIIDQGMLGEMLVHGGRMAEGCGAFAVFRGELDSFARRRDLGAAGFDEVTKEARQTDAHYCASAR